MVARHRGQIIVLSLAMVLVLAAVAMFAIDTGHIFTYRARIQNASDGAALAALYVLAKERSKGAGEADARAAAAAEAAAIAEANTSGAAVEVEFGLMAADGTFAELADDSVAATAARVAVTRDADATAGPLSLFFGPVFGLDSADVRASATTKLSSNICGVRSNLAPFAVYQGLVGSPGDIITFYPNGQDHSDADDLDEAGWPTVPGCFGLLNLDGGSFGTTKAKDWILNGYDGGLVIPPEVGYCFGLLNLDGGSFGTTKAKDWILNGYDGGLVIPPEVGYTWVSGGTGFRSSIRSAIEQRIGEPLIIAVYDRASGTGATAEFRVVSFMAVTITECQLTGSDKYIRGRIENLTVTGHFIAGGSKITPNLAKVQLAG